MKKLLNRLAIVIKQRISTAKAHTAAVLVSRLSRPIQKGAPFLASHRKFPTNDNANTSSKLAAFNATSTTTTSTDNAMKPNLLTNNEKNHKKNSKQGKIPKFNLGHSALFVLGTGAVGTLIAEKEKSEELSKETQDLIERAFKTICSIDEEIEDPLLIQNILSQMQTEFDKLVLLYPALKGLNIENFINDDVLTVPARELEKLCKNNPNLEALFNLYRAKVHYTSSQANVRRIMKVTENHRTAQVMVKEVHEKLDCAIMYAKKVLDLNSNLDLKVLAYLQIAKIYLEKAELHKKQGDSFRDKVYRTTNIHMAKRNIENASKLSQANTRVFLLLGDICLESEQDFNSAHENYSKAFNLANTDLEKGQANYRMASLFFQQHEYDKAITFVMHTKQFPIGKKQENYLHNILGTSYYHKKLYHEAIEYFEKAITSQKQDSELGFKLADSYALTGQYEKAVDCYNTTLILNGELTAVYLHRSRVFTKMGQYNEALSDLNTYLRKANEANDVQSKYIVLLNLGEVYQLTSDFDEAMRLYDQAINLNPQDERAYHCQALLLKKLKETEKNAVKVVELVDKAKKKLGDSVAETLGSQAKSEREIVEYTIEDEERLFKEAYVKAVNGGETDRLTHSIRNRGQFTEVELSKLLSECGKEFAVDFDNRETNPTRIDKIVDKLLSLEIFENKVASPMSHFREAYQFKYDQHLHDRGDVLLPNGDPKQAISGVGFQPHIFLPLRIRSYLSIVVRLQRNVLTANDLLPKDSKSQIEANKVKEELINNIKREIIADIETFRSYRDGHCLNETLSKTDKPQETLLTAHIENVKEKILKLAEGTEYSYYTGHKQHAIYVNFFKKDGKISARIDNLGDGYMEGTPEGAKIRHNLDVTSDGHMAYPCLINNFDPDSLDQYLRNLHQAKKSFAYLPPYTKTPPDPNYKWTWIYCKKCEQTRHDFPAWKPEKPQTVGNCVLKSHNVGVRIRAKDDRHFLWILEKEKAMAAKMKDNPDYFKEAFQVANTDLLVHSKRD